MDRQPDQGQIKAWRDGVVLPGGKKTAPAEVNLENGKGSQAWIGVTMVQGLKRQIRLTAQSLGLHVRRIIRIRMGKLKLDGLQPGDWRYLKADEIEDLKGTTKR